MFIISQILNGKKILQKLKILMAYNKNNSKLYSNINQILK